MKSNKKILVFVGTRPEAIKMFPLIDLLSRHYNLVLCLTGQHKELLDLELITQEEWVKLEP